MNSTIALGAVVIAGLTGSAMANSVQQVITDSNWSVTREYGGTTDGPVPASEVTRNAAWVNPATHPEIQNAKWISYFPDGGSNNTDPADNVTYVYTSTHYAVAGSAFNISGYYSADNYVDHIDIYVNGVQNPTPSASANNIYSFQQTFGFGNNYAGGSPLDVCIVATVINAKYQPSAGPTGFIMQATITPVPLPPAVWSGVAALAGLAAVGAVRSPKWRRA